MQIILWPVPSPQPARIIRYRVARPGPMAGPLATLYQQFLHLCRPQISLTLHPDSLVTPVTLNTIGGIYPAIWTQKYCLCCLLFYSQMFNIYLFLPMTLNHKYYIKPSIFIIYLFTPRQKKNSKQKVVHMLFLAQKNKFQ